MRRWTNRIVVGLVAALIAGTCAGMAHAEIAVTVSITGTLDEVLPILRHLQDLGIGAAGEEAMKLQVHSVMSGAEVAPAVPAPLGFQAAAVEPVSAKAGDSVLITAKVGDPDHVVDTVAATVGGETCDLYDNGTNGDATALDGTWSRSVALPAGLPSGDAVIALTAYDVSGDAIQIAAPDGTKSPMTTNATVTVLPGSAPAPAPAAVPVPVPPALAPAPPAAAQPK
jgi:hypothetical protein